MPPFLKDPFSAESLSDADIEEGEVAGTGRRGGVGGGGGERGGGEVGENTGCLKGDSDREKRPIVSAKETCYRSSESVTEDSDVLTQTYALG